MRQQPATSDDAYETLRPLMFSIAYRMLGSADGSIQAVRSIVNPE